MNRIWQWAWDRFGPKYLWVLWLSACAASLPVFLVWAWIVLTFENSSRYGEASIVTVAVVLVMTAGNVFPVRRRFRGAEQWAAGHRVDRAKALEDSYIWTRQTDVRGIVWLPAMVTVLLIAVAAIAGADGPRLVQYGILGAAAGISTTLIGVHNFGEGALRPVRAS